jgi:hypothetical protein
MFDPATEILEAIIDQMSLTEAAAADKSKNRTSYHAALLQIQDFLDDEQEVYSEVIHVPGGAGVVRVDLERSASNITVRSKSFTPPGCPKEFVVPYPSPSQEP